MAQLIKEAKRFQQLAGIITEDGLGVNIISNPIIKPKNSSPKPTERPDGAYKLELRIDGETVMDTTADDNPSPEELSDVLTALESRYRSKFDFEKAEIVVLDPSGKQVGSVTKKDNFLRTKAIHVGDTYPQTHGTV
jgi:hypothetical protein